MFQFHRDDLVCISRVSYVSSVIVALFWGIWHFATGAVPSTVGLSRWWDVMIPALLLFSFYFASVLIDWASERGIVHEGANMFILALWACCAIIGAVGFGIIGALASVIALLPILIASNVILYTIVGIAIVCAFPFAALRGLHWADWIDGK